MIKGNIKNLKNTFPNRVSKNAFTYNRNGNKILYDTAFFNVLMYYWEALSTVSNIQQP